MNYCHLIHSFEASVKSRETSDKNRTAPAAWNTEQAALRARLAKVPAVVVDRKSPLRSSRILFRAGQAPEEASSGPGSSPPLPPPLPSGAPEAPLSGQLRRGAVQC